MFDIKIAECPECGQQYFGDSEEEVREKYKKHTCYDRIPHKEFWDKIDKWLRNES